MKNPLNKYKKKIKTFENKHHILAALLIGLALVLFWRGIWHVADVVIFPNNYFLSGVVCIVIAFIILYLRDFDLKELFSH